MPRKISIKTANDLKTMDEEASGSEAEEVTSRRRSTRTPKPVVRKSLRDASDSEVDSVDQYSEDERKGKRSPTKKPFGKKTLATIIGVKRSAPISNGTNKTKKTRHDDGESNEDFPSEEDDEEYSEEEEDEEEGNAKTPKGKKTGGGTAKKSKKSRDNEEEDEDDEDYGNLSFEDDEVEDKNWIAPDYTDKKWFKENCLICQICKKTFEQTGDALKCFHKHKDSLRCYVCFSVLKGGKDGTKRLFKHYKSRHPCNEKANSVRCPHCTESFAYKSVSCHIISIHFREALGLPDKAKAATQNGSAANKGKSGKKKSTDSDESEEEDEEEPDEDEEDEEEDDE